MTDYRATIVPLSNRHSTSWSLTVTVPAKSKNEARSEALRKTRRYLEDRTVRILRVQEA